MPRSAEEWERAQELFNEAVDLPPAERKKLLDRICGENETLRREVESLLDSDAQANSFIEDPAESIPRDFLTEPEENFSGRQFGTYRVIREIGRGGLGAVYLAARADESFEKQVALKVVKRGLDTDDILRRFRVERQILAQLEHPNIARLIDAGSTEDGLPYFVMEYVQGQSLLDYCDATGAGVTERLQLFRKICEAVAYAHQNLVIHRDLKPSNILVTAGGEPKLLDFGIAKVLTPEEDAYAQTIPSLRILTPEYASPEQIKGGKITTSSDVYSLGVLLYELLSGQKPYRLTSRSAEEFSKAITDQEPERPSTTRQDHPQINQQDSHSLRGDLDNIVLMALRKEPERRYASVERFSEDVRRHLVGLPVIAHKDTLNYRASKFVKRNKTGVAAVALIILALLGGLIATTWQTRIARQERDRARAAQTSAELARKQSERLNSFLQTLLSSADPSRLGRNVKVVEVLDAAGKSLDGELASEPELLAQAHMTMARAYQSLRDSEPAIRHARAALALTRRLHDKNDAATGQAASLLGVILRSYSRLAEAEPLLTEALGIYRQSRAEESSFGSQTLSTLAWLLSKRGHAKEGLPMAQEALEISRSLHGENSAEAIDALHVLGTVRMEAGDFEGAEASFRRAIALYDRNPRFDAAGIYARLNLVLMLYLQGRIPEVRPVLEKAREICEREIGQGNDLYGGILWRLGTLDFMQGEYSSALPQLRRGLELIAPVYADDQMIDVVHVRAMIGVALTRTGDPVAGEPLLRQALADGKKVPPAYFALTVGNLEKVMGECLLAQGRYAEAEPLLLSGHNDLKTRLGDKSSMTVAAARRLHEMYTAWHKPAEAARFGVQETPPAQLAR